MLYWDTSALVKQFIDEPWTDQALSLRAHAPPHATATIAYTETFSALRRRVRESELGEPQYHEVVRRFLQEWSAYVSTPFIWRRRSNCKTTWKSLPCSSPLTSNSLRLPQQSALRRDPFSCNIRLNKKTPGGVDRAPGLELLRRRSLCGKFCDMPADSIFVEPSPPASAGGRERVDTPQGLC